MKIVNILLATLLVFALTSCTYEDQRNKWSQRDVWNAKLKNGKTVRMGLKPASQHMDCGTPVAHVSHLFGATKVEGITDISGPNMAVYNQALDFANQNLNKTFNYIYVYLPNGMNLGFIDTTDLSHDEYKLYNCKNLPPVNRDPFNTKEDKA